MNIYSFLPAATEIVCALGLGEQLRGVTAECDYPPEARGKPVVVEPLVEVSSLEQSRIDELVVEGMAHGRGLYRIDKEKLRRVRPDVVITQELCDVCSMTLRDVAETVSSLAEGCTVLSLRPRGLRGVFDDIVSIGRACGAEERATRLVSRLDSRIAAVERKAAGLPRRRVFCMEWFDPIFASGHWVPEMVALAGGTDALGRPGDDSRRMPWNDVVAFDPEVLVLMPCGFDVPRAVRDVRLVSRLAGWDGISAVRDGRVYAANGSAYYSRPGPRLVDGLEYLASMIHPEAFGPTLPKAAAVRIEDGIPLALRGEDAGE